MEFNNKLEKELYITNLNVVLKDYLANDTITDFENTTGGIANKVIKITTDKGENYIFKIYKKKRNQTLPFEFMDFLKSNGVNIVFPKNKQPIIFENTDCYLFDYIDSSKTEYSEELATYLIKLLKIIKNFKTSINNKEYYYKTKCDNEYLLLRSKNNYKLDKEIINKVLDRYDEIKDLEINNEKSVVHSDISTSNLLSSPSGYYLIDFDETRFCSKLYDLAVILVKFFFDGKNIDIVNAKKFVGLYLENFTEYSRDDCRNVFEYYIVKQLLEKISDYEIFNIDIYSKQQQQDDFRNWVYYFNNFDQIKQIFN